MWKIIVCHRIAFSIIIFCNKRQVYGRDRAYNCTETWITFAFLLTLSFIITSIILSFFEIIRSSGMTNRNRFTKSKVFFCLLFDLLLSIALHLSFKLRLIFVFLHFFNIPKEHIFFSILMIQFTLKLLKRGNFPMKSFFYQLIFLFLL